MFSYQVLRDVRRYKHSSTKKLLEFLAQMPKAKSVRIAEAQRQRQHVSKKCDKYAPATVYLQVLGSGARGAPNTLYMFTDQKRYLFNCGECTQRLAHEHKVKLSKLDHIFITNKTWENIGGLPGLSLTLQDVGVPNITLHGPEGLDELYNATRRFIIMKDMNVTMAKCTPSEEFDDNNMTVKYVLLSKEDDLLTNNDLKPPLKRLKLDQTVDKRLEEFIHDDTDYYRSGVRKGDRNKNLRDKTDLKPDTKDNLNYKPEKHDAKKKNSTVAFICTLKKRLGTLDLAKCVELGVKPGPILGQLKAGSDVVLPDGTFVFSKDVKTPDDPGPVFIVLEVPEISYLKESEFSSHFDDGKNPTENIPALIVHYAPPEVLHHPRYQDFLALFGPTTQHMVLNTQNSCLGSEAVHRTQHKLHLLDPDIFPLLKDTSVPTVWSSHQPSATSDSPDKLKGLEELKNKIALAQFQNIINMEGSCKGDGQSHDPSDSDSQSKSNLIDARTLTTFYLRPKRPLDRSNELKLLVQEYIQEAMVEGFVDSLEQFRRKVEEIRCAKSEAKEYPKVVFLGTGSCIPSKTRNTSAIVVHVDENSSILLDCGEGTYGQLVRFYGPKRVNSFLHTLKAIYVSHLHADHHIGLIGVLLARRQAFAEVNGVPPDPVYLLAPGQIYTWLSLYDQQFDNIKGDFTLIPNQVLLHNSDKSEMSPAILKALGLQEIKTCLVSHCPNAFGVALVAERGHKITYSGDTIPCEELVKIGQNSTLLIHEATMEDELSEEARIKMHSTTGQAIAVGQKMSAKYTVLTHFSQRYARLPRLSPDILNDNKSVGIAFDNMQITMNDLELLSHMYAPLQLMFAEHCIEMELKAAHRARQKERRTSSPVSVAESESNRPKSRTRKVTNCCYLSAAPRAIYRETNASRLRQEYKGMPVSGIVKPMASRSPSLTRSPTQINSPVRNTNTRVSQNMRKVYTDASHTRTVSDKVVDIRSKTINSVLRGPSSKESVNSNNLVSVPRSPIKRPSSSSVKSSVTQDIKKQRVQSPTKRVSNALIRNVNSPTSKPELSKQRDLSTKNSSKSPTRLPSRSAPFVPNVCLQQRLKNTNNLRENRKTSTPIFITGNHQSAIIERTSLMKTVRHSDEVKSIRNAMLPIAVLGRPNSGLSAKSFKPNLEDIKSSYMLLNKTQAANRKTEPTDRVNKPNILNDQQRKRQLIEIKKRFKSKQFWLDSKYERIEGLNWISWK